MNGFGKLKNKNAEFYGYWKDDIHIDIGFETWIDFSNYFGEYKNGKKESLEHIFGQINQNMKENGKIII